MKVAHRMTAFMDDPDADKPNPIHSTSTARDFGFRAALVGGATAYGWTAAAIVEALGERWLDSGWAELRFRQPLYPDDVIDIGIAEDGELTVERGGELCFGGRVGLGQAPWLQDMVLPAQRPPVPRADPLPPLTLDTAPVGHDLAPRRVHVSVAEAVEFNTVRQRETLAGFDGPRPRLHPAWIAEQLIHLLHHSYDYGPSVHTASWIQHLAPAYADQDLIVRGHCVEAFERKGHHYIANDGSIEDESGATVARLRHTAIFQLRRG